MTPRAVRGVGLAGSTALAVGGYGAGAPADRVPLPGALALSAVGVAVLLAAWWLLRGAATRAVLAAAGAWSLPLLLAPPLFSRDLYAYAGQAHLVLAGLDPYANGPVAAPGPLSAEVDPVWAEVPSPYGPVFLRLAAGVVALTGERPLLAAAGLRLLAVAGVALLAWGLVRIAPSYGVGAGRALWLAVANPLVLLHGVAGGHNDLLMLGLLVLGLSVAPARPAGAAALITLGGLIKAPALLGLLFLPLMRGDRVRSGVVGFGAAAVTAVAVTAGTRLGWGWTGTLGAGGARRSLLSLTTGAGALFGHERAVQQGGLLLAGLLVAGLLVAARPETAQRNLGAGLLAVVLLSPVVQPWYLLWGVAVLAPVVDRRLVRGLAAGSAVLCLLILPSGRHLVRPPLYGVPLVLVVAVAAGVAVRGRPGVNAAPVG